MFSLCISNIQPRFLPKHTETSPRCGQTSSLRSLPLPNKSAAPPGSHFSCSFGRSLGGRRANQSFQSAPPPSEETVAKGKGGWRTLPVLSHKVKIGQLISA